MESRSELLAQALFDFRAQFLADEQAGCIGELESYQRRFPGFAEEVRAAYAELRGDTEPADEELSSPPPQRRIGHYRLLRLLGRGGQGSVHLAEDEQLGRKVALKLLGGFALFSPEARRRFQREAELASRLDHPGICTVYDSGVEGDLAYLVLRHIEGETLAARIARARAPEAATLPREALRPTAPADRAELEHCLAVFEGAARALHAAHELGVIHRDVKPGNVMITPAGEAVLLDFGLARDDQDPANPITRTGDLLGTPVYMSPEQIDPRGRRLDRRTDVYSLAAALYECLTLERPFQAPTAEKLYQAILAESLPDPRRRNRVLPRELVVVLETALSKEREQRYLSALEFAEELRRVRQHEVIHARPPSPWLRALRWTQRHPARAAACALLALLGAATVFAVVMRTRAGELQLAQDDRRFGERLLDQIADTPRRGAYFDWVRSTQGALALYAEQELPLDGSVPEDELERRLQRLAARAPELGSAARDGLYRLAAALDDVEFGPKFSGPSVPPDLQPSALRAREWSGPRALVLALLERVERDPWRRATWSAFRSSLAAHEDALQSCVDAPDLAQRPAADLLFLAELVYFVRRNDSVIRLYDEAELRPSTTPDLRYAIRVSRGLLRARSAQPRERESALIDLTAAYELRPESAPTCVGLAMACLASPAPDARAQALRYAGRAVAVDERSAAAHKLLAQLLDEAGRTDEAELHARRACELDPLDVAFVAWRADVRAAAGDLSGAAEAWRAAARAERSPEAVWRAAGRALCTHALSAPELVRFVSDELEDERSRSVLLCAFADEALRTGAVERAIEAGEAALERAPADPAVLTVLGRALQAGCEEEQALALLRTAVRLDPDAVGPTRALASLCASRGEAGEACAILEHLAVCEPQNLELAWMQANCWRTAGNPSRALECAQRVLDYEPANQAALGLAFEANRQLGRPRQAFEMQLARLALAPEHDGDLELALQTVQEGRLAAGACAAMVATRREAQPESASLCALEALLRLTAGDTTEGERLLRNAVDLDPRRAFALAYLGNWNARNGRFDESERLLRAALAREPGSDLVRALLIECASLRGDPATALAESLGAIRACSTRSEVWTSALESARLCGAVGPLLELGLQACARGAAPDAARFVTHSCLLDLGRFEQDCALWREELRAQPERLAVRVQAAQSVLRAGHWREAVDLLAPLVDVSKREPTSSWARLVPQLLARAQRCAEYAAKPDRAGMEGLEGAALASKLAYAGAFAEAAGVLFPEDDAAGAVPSDAQRLAAIIAAHAAETAWRSSSSGKPIAAPASLAVDVREAAAPRSREESALGQPEEPKSDERSRSQALALRGLDCLEREFARLREEHARESSSARRASLWASAFSQLGDPDVAFLRCPPAGAPWSGRAAAHFWSVREFLVASRRAP